MSIEARAKEISKSKWQMMHNCTQKAGAFGPPENGLGNMPGYCRRKKWALFQLRSTEYEIHNPVLDSQEGEVSQGKTSFEHSAA